MIPYGRQEITQSDIDAVTQVLTSDFLTQGPVVPRFEQSVAEKVGVKFALAVNSATSALHIACLALDVKKGDIVWTTPVTFVASANCARYCGADVDFVDIDPRTYNIDSTALRRKLEIAHANGTLPKVVIVVHLCGQSCDMVAIHALAQEYGFKVVEDASHAIGAKFKGEYVGNCGYSDITIFSFHPVKIVTTAEGGMACTNDETLARRMSLFRSHGITRDPEAMTHAPDGPWYYQQIELGYNYRMTELQAALGISQMTRLDEFVERRHEIARAYDSLLSRLPVTVPWQSPDAYSAFHLYVVRIRQDQARVNQLDVFLRMRSAGIGVNLHYIPVHTQPYYRSLGFNVGDFPNSEQYYKDAISLPMYPALTLEQQYEVVTALSNALQP